MPRRVLPPLPRRLGFLVHEGIDARLGILALDGAGHELGCEGVGLREVHLHLLMEHRLARRDLLRWLGGDVIGERHRFLVKPLGGATRLTSPSRSAVAASIDWPVNSMSSARLEPTLRPTGTEGVPQNRPLLMPEVAKLASLDATARSQAATSWQPAAVAIAWTLAMTGCGRRRIDIIIAEQRVSRS